MRKHLCINESQGVIEDENFEGAIPEIWSNCQEISRKGTYESRGFEYFRIKFPNNYGIQDNIVIIFSDLFNGDGQVNPSLNYPNIFLSPSSLNKGYSYFKNVVMHEFTHVINTYSNLRNNSEKDNRNINQTKFSTDSKKTYGDILKYYFNKTEMTARLNGAYHLLKTEFEEDPDSSLTKLNDTDIANTCYKFVTEITAIKLMEQACLFTRDRYTVTDDELRQIRIGRSSLQDEDISIFRQKLYKHLKKEVDEYKKRIYKMISKFVYDLKSGKFFDSNENDYHLVSEKYLVKLIKKSILNEMRAFHGTGARFNKFDSSYKETGEGSNAFGPGHYFTGSKQIGRDYANEHGTSKEEVSKFTFNGSTDKFWVIREIARAISKGYGYGDADDRKTEKEARKLYDECDTSNELIKKIVMINVNQWKEKNPNYKEEYEDWYKEEVQDLWRNLKGKIKDNSRTLYQVEIPDEDKYADWNSEVPEDIMKYIYSRLDNTMYKDKFDNVVGDYMGKFGGLTFETLYHSLDNMHYDASFGLRLFEEALKKAGYVGVKYPAGTNFQTSSTKNGDMNYTIFDDNNIKITNRWDL